MKTSCTVFLLALAALHSAYAADLFVRSEKIEGDQYDGDKMMKFNDICGAYGNILSDVWRIKSNRPAIDAVVNADIPDQAGVEKYINDALAEILEATQGMSKDDVGVTLCSRELVAKPAYLGHYKNIEQIEVYHYNYDGGAHGMYAYDYYLFDDKDKRLTLDDILEKNARDTLDGLLADAFVQYSKQHTPVENEAELRPEKGAMLQEDGDNFFFLDNGLVFSYAPYLIASFSEGQVELLLPYDKLKGVLKSEYLP